MGKVIAIMSGKGGVGKTTMTAYIGAALNRRGHRVLITDADFGMRDLDLVIGKENDIFFDAVDIWKDNCNQDSAIIPLTDDFDFLPATQTRRWEDVGRKGYAKLIKKLAESYDFVIIDAPAGIGRGNEAVFKAADQLLLVAEPMWVSLRAVQRVMQLCHEERQFNYALILNNVGRSEVAVAVEEALATLQVATILPHSIKLMSWAQDGTLHEFCDDAVDTMMVPLLEYIETSEVWPEEKLLDRWYQLQAAEEIAKEITPTANTKVEAAVTAAVAEAATAEPMVDRIVEGERVEVETLEVNRDSVSAHSDVATQNELVGNGAKVGAVPAVSDVADEASEDSAVEAKSMVEAVKTEMTAPVASSAKVAVEAAKSTAETAAAKAEDIVDSVTDKAEAVTHAASDKAEAVADAVSDKAEAVADAATDKAEAVAEKAEDLVEAVTDKVEEVVATVEDKTEEVVDKAKEVAEETAAEIKAVTDESAEEKEEPAQPKKMSLFEVFKKKISSLWS